MPVLNQLKCGGILESIRICLEGYPYKKPFSDFFKRYKALASYSILKTRDTREACVSLLEFIKIDKSKYQCGTTKLFLRAGQIEVVEKLRTNKLSSSAGKIQKNWRRYMAQKKYRRILHAIVTIQCGKDFSPLPNKRIE